VDCGTEGVVEDVFVFLPYLGLDELLEPRVGAAADKGGLDEVAVRLECNRAVEVVLLGSLPRRGREGV
jgi:hypothetical protein